jgi:hypothetical protein
MISVSPVSRAVESKDDRTTTSTLKPKKLRLTVQVHSEVLERVKNAVYWTPGLTLAALAEEALIKAVDALEKKCGKQFPTRAEELKGGRPLN